MDDKLILTRNRHETCLQANNKLAVLWRVEYFERHTIYLIYKFTPCSIIEYGLELYYYCTDKEISKYDRVQYNVAKKLNKLVKKIINNPQMALLFSSQRF